MISKDHPQEATYCESNWWRHVTPKCQGHDRKIFEAQYLKTVQDRWFKMTTQLTSDHQLLAGTTASVTKPSEWHSSWNGNIIDCTLPRHWQPGISSSTFSIDSSSESLWCSGPQQSMPAAAIHGNCGKGWMNCCSHQDNKCRIKSWLKTSLRKVSNVTASAASATSPVITRRGVLSTSSFEPVTEREVCKLLTNTPA